MQLVQKDFVCPRDHRGFVNSRRGTAVAAALALAACGSKGTPPSPPLTCSTLPNATTILILNNAVCPQTLPVPPGSRVTFINNDGRSHFMASDPHPDHTECPEINQVGLLNSGQQRETGNLNTVRSCGFHDHDLAQNRALQGTIVIR
jgi:plastocyanin